MDMRKIVEVGREGRKRGHASEVWREEEGAGMREERAESEEGERGRALQSFTHGLLVLRGGWDCSNPSYHAPGHYVAMRDFMSTFAPTWGTHGDEGRLLAPRWASLIYTSFHIVSDSQCRASGLIPNWFVPSQSPLPTAGTAGCSGSGTPAAQFGSEASRSAWRMGVAWLWYADERAANICQRLARHAAGALASYKLGSCDHADSCAGLQLPLELSSPLPSVPPMPPPITHPLMPPPLMPPHTSTLPPATSHSRSPSCLHVHSPTPTPTPTPTPKPSLPPTPTPAPACVVTSVHTGWLSNGFILGPVATALMVPPPEGEESQTQQAALDTAAELLAAMSINSYYSGSWVTRSLMTLTSSFLALPPVQPLPLKSSYPSLFLS